MSAEHVDFFIVGAMKSGTTSLRTALSRSPDINMYPKEMNFFNKVDAYARGFDWYHAQFKYNEAGVLRGEKTPTYGFSADWADRIADYNPAAKILWILRDPVQRAVSNYYHVRHRRDDAPNLEQAIENRVRLERRNAPGAYVYRSQYEKHLENFSRFPSEQTRILIFEEMLDQGEAEIEETFRFLGVPSPSEPTFPHSNKGRAELRDRLPIADATLAELRRLLRPTVDAVETRLGRALPAWRQTEAS